MGRGGVNKAKEFTKYFPNINKETTMVKELKRIECLLSFGWLLNNTMSSKVLQHFIGLPRLSLEFFIKPRTKT